VVLGTTATVVGTTQVITIMGTKSVGPDLRKYLWG
jgi:hypothetical protein